MYCLMFNLEQAYGSKERKERNIKVISIEINLDSDVPSIICNLILFESKVTET